MFGQTEDKKFIAAEEFFLHGNFASAEPLYLDLLKKDSTDAYLNFKTGLCYLNSRSQKHKAVFFLQNAVSPLSTINYAYSLPAGTAADFFNVTAKEIPTKEVIQHVSYKYLGDAYYFIYEFERAISCYRKYKEKVSLKKNEKQLQEEINKNIDLCYFGKKLDQLQPLSIDLKHGNVFNSRKPYDAPSLIPPKLIASRNDSIKEFLARNNFSMNLPVPVSDYAVQQVHTKSCFGKTAKEKDVKGNETTVGTSTDGQIVLVYRVNQEGVGNLYTTRLMGNEWTTPEKLDKIVNNNGWETGEFISADGATMYFSSDKPGGFGGKDIYVCKKTSDGKWGKELNLGPAINTRNDEDAPFIYPNGSTLYFRSNGHKASGCYDIFLSTLTESGWSAPVNVGYPADVKSEDIQEPSTHALSSTVDQLNTNYMATFFNLEKVPLTLLKRQVVDMDGKPITDVKITTTNIKGEISAVYSPNRGSGNYLFLLPESNGTFIHYEAKGYYFQSEYVDLSQIKNMYETFKAVQMLSVSKGATIVLNSIFFNADEPTVPPVSEPELERLTHFLLDNKNLKAQVVGYVKVSDNTRHNKKLAKARAQALADYLTQKGVDKNRIVTKGYGKMKQKVSGKQGLSPESQLKQRFEVKIINS